MSSIAEKVRVLAASKLSFEVAHANVPRKDTALTVGDLGAIRALCVLVSDVPGDTAEVGVFLGGGSKLIAATLQDRIHYACDTFTGLPNCDVQHDDTYSNGAFRLDEATKDRVVSELKRTPNIEVCEGVFDQNGHPDIPEGATFAFVHVDGDTYWTAKHALEFFWPRIYPGGLLLFHDYGFVETSGVTTAVNEWLAENPKYHGTRIGLGHHLAIAKVAEGPLDDPIPYDVAAFAQWVRGRHTWQDGDELAEASAHVADLAPRVVLEIGSNLGGTLLAWADHGPDLMICIDIEPNAERRRVIRYLDQRLPLGCREFIGNSHDPGVVEQVRGFLSELGETIDFLFIDGDHTYRGVSRDHEAYTPLLSDYALTGFHDISHFDGCDVPRYWEEVSKLGRSQSIVLNQSGLGIGLLWQDLREPA